MSTLSAVIIPDWDHEHSLFEGIVPDCACLFVYSAVHEHCWTFVQRVPSNRVQQCSRRWLSTLLARAYQTSSSKIDNANMRTSRVRRSYACGSGFCSRLMVRQDVLSI